MISYTANTAQTVFYAGDFQIDTGFSDPAAWASSSPLIELYGARVYAKYGYGNTAGSTAGAFAATVRIEVVPMWSVNIYNLPAGPVASSNIHLNCRVFFANLPSKALGIYHALKEVEWSLYRI